MDWNYILSSIDVNLLWQIPGFFITTGTQKSSPLSGNCPCAIALVDIKYLYAYNEINIT